MILLNVKTGDISLSCALIAYSMILNSSTGRPFVKLAFVLVFRGGGARCWRLAAGMVLDHIARDLECNVCLVQGFSWRSSHLYDQSIFKL